MKNFISLIIILLTLSNCKKESAPITYDDCSQKTNEITKVRQLIVGTYNWTKTYIYHSTIPDTLTPENQSRTEQYHFNENGTVTYLLNNQLQWVNNYDVNYEYKLGTYPTDSLTLIFIKDSNTGQLLHYFRPYVCHDSANFYYPFTYPSPYLEIYTRN